MKKLETKTTYPNKFDATQYVSKRVANDLYMFIGGVDMETNKEAATINNLWFSEEVVDRAMNATKYYNVVKGTMEESDKRYIGFDWWQVIDEDTVNTMCDDALFLNYNDYVELYNLTELAG